MKGAPRSVGKAAVVETDAKVLSVMARLQYFALFVMMVAGALTAYVYYNQRQDLLMAAPDNKPMLLVSDSMPNTSPEAVVEWAGQAIIAIYNYDMNNIDARLLDAEKYFTPPGWISFLNAVIDQEVIEKVKATRQIVTTVLRSTPIIIKEGEEDGLYKWTVTAEIQASIDIGGASPQSRDATVTLEIHSMPTLQSLGGYAFGINKITR